ncbi:hypothetical protein [Paenibacillus rhizoplanae]|uniref:Uncharacterized protein n=1 Tax=Paenibacillus rhizoplanae TaxID=1917181 RepID=A0ABW5F656_9BACL
MIQWIKIYFRKRKLIKMLQQLSSEMILLPNSEPNFIHHQEKLMLQRYLISDEQIATFLNPHVHGFYSEESPYKINSVLETYFETAKIEFATFPMYIQLVGIFQNQKLRYWTSYANFEKAIQKQNQLIEAHTQKAEMFLLEIDKIRQDYFTHSILARLVNHYKDTYQFFRSGEQNGISSCIKQGYIYYDL